VRLIGVLMALDENDPLMKAHLSAFTQALAGLGWADGRNVRMELRWGRADINRIRALAQELVGLQPDIIATNGAPATAAVQRETRTIPIVFANVGDPVATGIVERLDRPNGNVTGFATLEASLGGKWLELLSEIAPGLKRAAIMFNPDTAQVSTFMPSFETAARSLRVVPIPAPVHRCARKLLMNPPAPNTSAPGRNSVKRATIKSISRSKSTWGCRPRARAATWWLIALTRVPPAGSAGSKSAATDVIAGTASCSTSNLFASSSWAKLVTPVRLPPGRFKLLMRPARTGSTPTENTIGIFVVRAFAATLAGKPTATITLTCRRTRSSANAGS
jgi:hypothetical protein